MYAGSYSAVDNISGATILWGIALILASATFYILPIVMACRFRCKNRVLIIVLHIVLSFFGIGSIVSLIMIAVDKKKSQFYEDTGKNIVWFHIILYALSILVLFTPMAKVKHLEDYEINGLTSFNLGFFLGKKYELIGRLMNQDDYKLMLIMIWVIIGILALGFILNLIFRDARKLIGINIILQGVNAGMMMLFVGSFDNGITVPGIAFVWEGLITIAFVISLYIVTLKISYVDN